jgi:hypothetical protein
MKKEDAATKDGDRGEKGLFVGDGSTPNYTALVLLLVGGVLAGLGVYDSVTRGTKYVTFTAAALLCSVLGMALFMWKGGKKREGGRR